MFKKPYTMKTTTTKTKTTKVKLTILDRITLPSILKKEGNYVFMTIKEDIIKKAAIKSDEIKKFKIQPTEDRRIIWDEKFSEETFEIEFEELEFNEIKLACKELNDTNKLNSDTKFLYEKFVLNK